MNKGWYNELEEDVIPKYLDHIAFTHPEGALGSLKDFKEHFKAEYIQEIERKTLIFRTDKGMIDLDKEIDPVYFKEM